MPTKGHITAIQSERELGPLRPTPRDSEVKLADEPLDPHAVRAASLARHAPGQVVALENEDPGSIVKKEMQSFDTSPPEHLEENIKDSITRSLAEGVSVIDEISE